MIHHVELTSRQCDNPERHQITKQLFSLTNVFLFLEEVQKRFQHGATASEPQVNDHELDQISSRRQKKNNDLSHLI